MALKLGINLRTVPVTSHYTVTAFDDIINVDATSGAVTITLPDATTIPGKQFKVNKVDSTSNAVTLTGSQTINGLSSVLLINQNESTEIASVNNVYMSVGAGLQSIQSSIVGNKNIIINGNFDFWQRGTSFSAIGNDTYCADRWTNNLVGIMAQTFAQSTDVPTVAQSGFKSNFSLLCTTTTAESSMGVNDYRAIKYHIEGSNLAEIFGNFCTLSFWCKSNKIGVYTVFFQDGAGVRGYVTSITINNANTWEKKFVNIPVTDSTGASFNFDNTLGMKFLIVLAAGTNHQGGTSAWTTGNTTTFAVASQVNNVDTIGNTFYLAQVMLNKGSFPAPFVRAGNTYGGELLLCQRYRQQHSVFFGIAFNTTSINNQVELIVPMRTTPTISAVNADSTTAASLQFLQGNNYNQTQSSPHLSTDVVTTRSIAFTNANLTGLTQGGAYAHATGDGKVVAADAEF